MKLRRFSDGGTAEFHDPSDLNEGSSVTLRRGLSPDCLRFLFDLLKAAEWVIFSLAALTRGNGIAIASCVIVLDGWLAPR